MKYQMRNVNTTGTRIFKFLLQLEKSIFYLLFNRRWQYSFLTYEFWIQWVVMVRRKCGAHRLIHAKILYRLISYLHSGVVSFAWILDDRAIL